MLWSVVTSTHTQPSSWKKRGICKETAGFDPGKAYIPLHICPLHTAGKMETPTNSSMSTPWYPECCVRPFSFFRLQLVATSELSPEGVFCHTGYLLLLAGFLLERSRPWTWQHGQLVKPRTSTNGKPLQEVLGKLLKEYSEESTTTTYVSFPSSRTPCVSVLSKHKLCFYTSSPKETSHSSSGRVEVVSNDIH